MLVDIVMYGMGQYFVKMFFCRSVSIMTVVMIKKPVWQVH